MTDFVTSNTHQSIAASGQTLPSFPGGTTTVPALATSGATFTAGSAPLLTVGTPINTSGAVTKTYIATNNSAVNALTAGAIQMYGSNDLVNWYPTGSVLTITTLAALTSVTVATDTQVWHYIRPQVSTAITSTAATVSVAIAV